MDASNKKETKWIVCTAKIITLTAFILPLIFNFSLITNLILGCLWVSGLFYIILNPLIDKQSYESRRNHQKTEYKNQKKNFSKVYVFMGIAFIICSTVLTLTERFLQTDMDTATYASSLFTVGMVFTLLGLFLLFKMKRKQDMEKVIDERIKKMAVYAFVYSWYITFISICAFWWMEYTLNLSEIWNFNALSIYLSLVFFIMVASVVLLQQYFYKKPDLNVW